MKRFFGRRLRQRGAALILFATVLIVGVAWYAVGALGKAPVATAEREVITGRALQAAKQALLSYVAQYAARSTTADPGQMPCPESLTLANPGEASTSCSATMLVVGRLPWKTLGIDPLRDGAGEPLWYMMRGFRDPPINLVTAGQLTYAGSTVVAMIIAPGVALNTAATAGAPPAGCTQQNQMVATRNTATLNAANFLECGVATGGIASPGDSTWTNDRVITITAAEWVDAISGAIADRLQRQVAPAMYDFYNTTSNTIWGQRFFPNSSIFNSPTGTDLCGDNNQREGKPPTATVAAGTCDTDWDGGDISGAGLSFGGCTVFSTWIRCEYTVLLGGILTPRVDVYAPRIGYSFRTVDPSQITVQVNNVPASAPYTPATVGSFASSVSAADGRGTFSFQVTLPALAIASTVRVRIPHPTDALLADARSAWYVNNEWGRYTYYGVARPATSDPGGTCNPGGVVTDCLTVSGMPAPNNDKRLVLMLMGRALAGQTWGTTNGTDYFESLTSPANAASNTTLADRNYTSATVTSTFNDRLAACPYHYYAADGVTVLATACN